MPKKPEHTVDFLRCADLPPQQVASELSHALRLRGYATVKLGSSKEGLESILTAAKGTKDQLEAVPDELLDSFLGPNGTGAVAQLREADDLPEVFREKTSRMRALAKAALEAEDNLPKTIVTKDYLVQGGGCEGDVELTEADCSEWIQTLSRARMMLIYIFGKGQGTLEIMPFGATEEVEPIEFVTESDVLVMLHSDISWHKHVSTRGTFALVSWVLDGGPSTTRGWSGAISRTFGATQPAVKELQEWSQDRMEELAALHAAQQLEAPLPREWERMVRHSYFSGEIIPIAVTGQAGHHATSNNTHLWYSAMINGTDMVSDVPFSRWDHDTVFDPDPNCWMESQMYSGEGMLLKTSIRHAQFVEGVELFDNKFFQLSSLEAGGMDPQQRHVLETSYEALFNSGYRKAQLQRAYIAVFTGGTHPEYSFVPKDVGALSGTGASAAITSNRVSFLLGIMGPSTTIDCDLSSSAMAVVMGNSAVSNQNPRRNKTGGTSSAALASGVYFVLSPFMWPRWNAFMNPAGRSFCFDQQANGYVMGECSISTVLKPYAEKVDGELLVSKDPCIGSMVGWHVVNNGRNASMSAPCGPAEQEVISESFRMANLSPLDVDAMECHAEGAKSADSVELAACCTALRGSGTAGAEEEMLIFGSCKSNTGVQREACFMSAFLKVLFSITYGNNCPNLHLKQLNPYFEPGDAAHCITSESIAYRDSRVFHGAGARGWGGTSINLVCWGASKAVRANQVKFARQSFAYWPGGGDTAKSYYLIGTWNNWQPEAMTRQENTFTATVTLGAKGFECFQVCLDEQKKEVLHPERPNATSGSRAFGPNPFDLVQQHQLSWTIDGRFCPPVGSALARARDAGDPGDQYLIKLWTSHLGAAITWERREQHALTF
ncbi:Non-reducing polyketide synthase pyr2 (Pyripyropene synthesis protein 2) [Durusdinium trenchii]|uniref:Non-reducing polyketide synthase pyr2 (Pyripyropene synthesis protein 2) n=1 Tax=Durusdinium trenchii TaxID=1381693 RepID=A0ABP0NN11_9DINO